jgi:hypothetical protein
MTKRSRPSLDSALAVLTGRRRELEESVEAAERGAAIEKHLSDMRTDVARHEAKRERFLAIGDKPIELVHKQFDQRFGIVIEFVTPSRLTGAEYAEVEATNIAHLEGEIAKAEAELTELLAGARR